MQKVLKEDPLPPSTLNVQLLPEMDAVVRKALAKRPDERFQSAKEFVAALRAAAAEGRTLAPGGASSSADATLISTPDPTPVAPNRAPPVQIAAGVGPGSSIPPPTMPPVAPTSPEKKSLAPTVAVVVAVAVIAIAAVAWFMVQRGSGDGSKVATAQPPLAAVSAPAAPSATPPPTPAAATATRDPGTMVISAVGLVDPSDPRYQSDKTLLQNDLRADSRSQLVEKALGMLIDTKSMAKNYDLLKDKLLSKSGSFVTTVVSESEPRVGKDGLMSITTEGVVNVKAVQKSLNQMSRDDRVEFIRANGDPKVSVRIMVRDADVPDAPPQPSLVAENILKERIQSFGFRTWSTGSPGADDTKKGADFEVIGEAKIKKLSVRLEASGVIISKYALTSWTVKCVDRETGEEIYFNTTLPKGVGSWATEEEAIKAIGAKVADEFSREFFLQHVNATGKKVTVSVEGLPASALEPLARELVGLPDVIAVGPGPAAGASSFELQLAGAGSAADLVAAGVLKPLNAKLGQPCFSLGSVTADRVAVIFDKTCADASVISRFDTIHRRVFSAPPGDRSPSSRTRRCSASSRFESRRG
jgi:serine/threonine-protein kinase